MLLHRVGVLVVGAKDLPAMDGGKSSDPYVKVTLNTQHYQTPVLKKTTNPSWNYQVFLLYNREQGPHTITFDVWDHNVLVKDRQMGTVYVDLLSLELNVPVERWCPLVNVAKNAIGAEMHVKLVLLPPVEESRKVANSGVEVVHLPPGMTPGEYAQRQQWQQHAQVDQWAKASPEQQQWQQQQWQQQQWQQQQWQQQQWHQHQWQQQQMYMTPEQQRQQMEWQRLTPDEQHQEWERWRQQREVAAPESSEATGRPTKVSDDGDDKLVKQSKKQAGEAEPVLVMEIKGVLPQASYKEIVKALTKYDNNKEEALKELVIVLANRKREECAKEDEA